MSAERNHKLTRSHLMAHTSENKWPELKTFLKSLLVCKPVAYFGISDILLLQQQIFPICRNNIKTWTKQKCDGIT